jgi:hypothetical protein
VVNDWRRRVSLAEDASYSSDDGSDGDIRTHFSYFEEFLSSMRKSRDHKSLVEALQGHYPHMPTEGETRSICHGKGLIRTLSFRH